MCSKCFGWNALVENGLPMMQKKNRRALCATLVTRGPKNSRLKSIPGDLNFRRKISAAKEKESTMASGVLDQKMERKAGK
jgi:hypothetical protein